MTYICNSKIFRESIFGKGFSNRPDVNIEDILLPAKDNEASNRGDPVANIRRQGYLSMTYDMIEEGPY